MGCSVGFKYAKNALAAGAPPRTPLGKLKTLPNPRPPSRLGRGPHPLGAFGASILVPTPVEAWCPRLI